MREKKRHKNSAQEDSERTRKIKRIFYNTREAKRGEARRSEPTRGKAWEILWQPAEGRSKELRDGGSELGVKGQPWRGVTWPAASAISRTQNVTASCNQNEI